MVACLNDILVPVYGLGPSFSIVLRDFSPVYVLSEVILTLIHVCSTNFMSVVASCL